MRMDTQTRSAHLGELSVLDMNDRAKPLRAGPGQAPHQGEVRGGRRAARLTISACACGLFRLEEGRARLPLVTPSYGSSPEARMLAEATEEGPPRGWGAGAALARWPETFAW